MPLPRRMLLRHRKPTVISPSSAPSGDSTKATASARVENFSPAQLNDPAFVLRERIIQKLGAPSAQSRPDENPVNTIWITDHSIDAVGDLLGLFRRRVRVIQELSFQPRHWIF